MTPVTKRELPQLLEPHERSSPYLETLRAFVDIDAPGAIVDREFASPAARSSFVRRMREVIAIYGYHDVVEARGAWQDGCAIALLVRKKV